MCQFGAQLKQELCLGSSAEGVFVPLAISGRTKPQAAYWVSFHVISGCSRVQAIEQVGLEV